MLIWHPL